MVNPLALSDDALNLLRLHLAGRTLLMRGPKAESLPGRSVEETRAAYRELVLSELMYPVSGFTHGPESHYRVTEDGWNRRAEFLTTPASAHLPR